MAATDEYGCLISASDRNCCLISASDKNCCLISAYGEALTSFGVREGGWNYAALPFMIEKRYF